MTKQAWLTAWCVEREIGRVAVHARSDSDLAELSDVLATAGIDVAGETIDAALWLDDTASVIPRPVLTAGIRTGGHLLIEASLAVSELMPVVVEFDRVALVSGAGTNGRRIDVVRDEMRVEAIAPWSLVELDGHLREREFELTGRTVDWHDETAGPDLVHPAGAPCHLSRFRNVSKEPG